MRKFLIAFTIVSGALSIFLLNKVFWDLQKYISLDNKAFAEITKWEINENKKGRFLISATYNYNVKNKKVVGKTVFKKNQFLNYYAAFSFLNGLANKDFYVWYSSKNIKNSNLEKYFPTKIFIYANISIGIFLYFILFFRKIRKFE